MAVKQNTQVVVPSLDLETARDPQRFVAWWMTVQNALLQVLPQLVSNSNELVDGKVRLLEFQKLPAAPTNVKEGQVAWADGTNWNPGSGAGLYEYRSGSWNKI